MKQNTQASSFGTNMRSSLISSSTKQHASLNGSIINKDISMLHNNNNNLMYSNSKKSTIDNKEQLSLQKRVIVTKGQRDIASARRNLREYSAKKQRDGDGSNQSRSHSRILGSSLSRERNQSITRGIKEVNNQHERSYSYSYPDELRPSLMLFKLLVSLNSNPLAKQVDLGFVSVPDTLVFNDVSGIPNFWLKTFRINGSFQMRRLEIDRAAIIREFIGQPFDPMRDSIQALNVVALLKSLPEDQAGCKTDIIHRYNFESFLDQVIQVKNKPFIIQKYMKPKSNHCFKVRTVFRKTNKVQFTNFIVTNRNEFCEHFALPLEQDDLDSIKQAQEETYLISMDSPDVSIVKQLSSNPQSDPTIQATSQLLTHFSSQCNLHFTSMIVDFVKEHDPIFNLDYYSMTSIVSYRFDQALMNTSALSMHQYTLSRLDDPRTYQVSLPLQMDESVQEGNVRRCGMCELIVTCNDWKVIGSEDIVRMKKECNRAAGKDIYKNLQEISNIQESARAVDVCRDCFFLVKKLNEALMLQNQFSSILNPNQVQADDEKQPGTNLRVFLYFKSIEDSRLAKCDKILHSLTYSINNQSQRIKINPTTQVSNTINEIRPIRTLKIHTVNTDNEKFCIEQAKEIIKQLSFRVLDPYREEISSMKVINKDIYLDLNSTIELKLEAPMLSVKLLVAIDFGGKTLPEHLMNLIDEVGKISQPSTQIDLSVNDSLANDINPIKSTYSLNSINQQQAHRKIRPRSSKLQTVRAFAAGAHRPMSGHNNNQGERNLGLASQFKTGTMINPKQCPQLLPSSQSKGSVFFSNSKHSTNLVSSCTNLEHSKAKINQTLAASCQKSIESNAGIVRVGQRAQRPKSAQRKITQRQQMLPTRETLNSAYKESMQSNSTLKKHLKSMKSMRVRKTSTEEDSLLNKILQQKLTEQKLSLNQFQGRQSLQHPAFMVKPLITLLNSDSYSQQFNVFP